MVDPTQGIGSIQKVSGGNTERAQERREEQRAEKAERSDAPREDKVEISEEAEALSAASNTRVALVEDEAQTLGLDPGFVTDV